MSDNNEEEEFVYKDHGAALLSWIYDIKPEPGTSAYTWKELGLSHTEALIAERNAARAHADRAEAVANEQTTTIAYWSNVRAAALSRAERADAALERRTKERDRARSLAVQLFDMLDNNARCEVVEGFAALLADEPPEEKP